MYKYFSDIFVRTGSVSLNLFMRPQHSPNVKSNNTSTETVTELGKQLIRLEDYTAVF
jgi:hypothetical protein